MKVSNQLFIMSKFYKKLILILFETVQCTVITKAYEIPTFYYRHNYVKKYNYLL